MRRKTPQAPEPRRKLGPLSRRAKTKIVFTKILVKQVTIKKYRKRGNPRFPDEVTINYSFSPPPPAPPPPRRERVLRARRLK